MMKHKKKNKGEGYYDVVNYYRLMCSWDGYFRRGERSNELGRKKESQTKEHLRIN